MSNYETAFSIPHSPSAEFFPYPRESKEVGLYISQGRALSIRLKRPLVFPDLPGIQMDQAEEQMGFIGYDQAAYLFADEEWNSRENCAFEVGRYIETTSPFSISLDFPVAFIEADRLSCLELLGKLPAEALPETLAALTELCDRYHSIEHLSLRRPMPLLEERGSAERISESITDTFHQLKEQWYNATAFVSSGTEIINHPAHQQILDLGPAAVPLIVEELRQGRGHWFSALHKLTGYRPAEEHCGNMGKMRDAWLQWADEHIQSR